MAESLPADREKAFWAGVENARRFFMGEADVQRALERLARVLDEERIPHAIVDAMALNEWGYRRVTVDVDVLLAPEGLRALKAATLGRGYVEKFRGSCGLRDAETGVTIDVVLAGEYPGDGKPKPVAFPDPAQAAVRGRRVALLPLPRLIELKLASGMTAPHRLKDLKAKFAATSKPRRPIRSRTGGEIQETGQSRGTSRPQCSARYGDGTGSMRLHGAQWATLDRANVPRVPPHPAGCRQGPATVENVSLRCRQERARATAQRKQATKRTKGSWRIASIA